MTFEITILGCGAATPSAKHNPSAQLVDVHDKYFLVDCGEGTQMQLRKYRIKMQRINHIFISHLHGDHFFGLPGLISSFHLLGRIAPLHIFGPAALKEILDVNFLHSETFLNFPLVFHPVQSKQKEKIVEDRTLEVFSVPLKHRIDCTGYIFREKEKPYKIIKEKMEEYRLQPSQMVDLKKGMNITLEDGRELGPKELCHKREHIRTYAYCSDTAYSEKLAENLLGVDVIYHESTFQEKDKDRAKKTMHSTAIQAAQIAILAQAKHLLLGHYSARYSNDQEFLLEAQTVFQNCTLTKEGLVFAIELNDSSYDVKLRNAMDTDANEDIIQEMES